MGRSTILKKIAALWAFTVFLGISAFGQDLIIRPQGFGALPLGSGNKTLSGDARYRFGGGGSVGLDFDFSSVWPNKIGLGWTAGLEGGIVLAPVSSGDGNLAIYGGGLALGAFYFPVSRLFLGLDGAVGVHQDVLEGDKTKAGLWWRGGFDAGFRFTPSFILTGGAGWRQYHGAKIADTAWSGLAFGLGARIAIHLGKSRAGSVTAEAAQDDGVYPVFGALYRENGAAAIALTNSETAEIRNVEISFRAPPYTASELLCGTLEVLPRGRTAEIPLLADFSPEILRFTEDGRVMGEVVVRYRMLGKAMEAASTVSLRVHNRNIYPGGNWGGLAAFVSPASTEILEFSKSVVGIARGKRRTGLNANMQNALYLFEAMKAAGVAVRPGGAPNEAQFPAQTLAYKSGTVCDAALLYCASLEAAGIPAAFIPLKNDFVACANLGVDQAAAETLFAGTDALLIIDGEVWLPVSAAKLESGFSEAWKAAAQALAAHFASGADAEFIKIEESWAAYPPAPFPALGVRPAKIDASFLAKNADGAVDAYIASDIAAVLRDVQAQAARTPTAALLNRLGIVQVRAGRLNDAKASFERAAGMGSAAAIRNRANIALTEGNEEEAARWLARLGE